MTVLILGGTAEARDLAAALVGAGRDVVSSLAGRVRNPTLPVGGLRFGGFGGVAGLANYLRTSQVSAFVDATHPFAVQISSNAVSAAEQTGIPLLRLERPGWADHPRASSWTWVPDVEAARAAGERSARPFLTIGRQSLKTFLPWADRPVTARVVDRPDDFILPTYWTLLTSRGPYSYPQEHRILIDHRIDLLITKDSGGSHTAAKLAAAADLHVGVVIIARPVRPQGSAVATVAEAKAWCDTQLHFAGRA
ncbi:MAG: cobK [Propionibacteriaceae bacterium]|nr:cobK [Propionibacteriaceae bacterium]